MKKKMKKKDLIEISQGACSISAFGVVLGIFAGLGDLICTCGIMTLVAFAISIIPDK